MSYKGIVGCVILACIASAAPAAFVGTIDFEDGTTGALIKEIQVSNPQTYTVGDFGGPGTKELNYAGIATGGFQSEFLVVDTSGTGAGDVYGDVTVQSLYKPSISYEFAVAARVQELKPGGAYGGTGSAGWGIWATQSTNWATSFSIAVETSVNGQGQIRAGTNQWANGDAIAISSSTWYDVTLAMVGLTATATMTELDANFTPVAGHTATITYTDTLGEMQLTGMVGTRSAQNASDINGYVLDNFTVTPVPEPASMSLLALAGLALIRRRRTA